MKKWFEWQQQHFDPGENPETYVYCNLHDETQCVRDWIAVKPLVFQSQPGQREWNGPNKQFIQSMKEQAIRRGWNVDPDKIEEWIQDPEYSEYFKKNWTHDCLGIPDFIRHKFIKNAKAKLSICWDTAEITLTVNRPGDIFPLHFDNFTNYEKERKIDVSNRWIIMLYDQQPGQCMMVNNEYISWHAGDTIGWNRTNYSHGSANFGYHNRYSLRITAKKINP
jgi:hypothetical protein